MKGLIFTQFLELVETQYGYAMVDDIIESCDLASGGAYTDIGNYPYTEIVLLISALSNAIDVPIDKLLKFLGEHLFVCLERKSPVKLQHCGDSFDFLESLDGVVHAEVMKLYPDAEVPIIFFEKKDKNQALLHYESCRPLAKLAEGLLIGCATFFDNAFTVEMLDKKIQQKISVYSNWSELARVW